MTSSALDLCQSSLHSFIASIPSEASDLAVNAVNCYVEDQVTDPKNLAKNISRVKSLFSACKRSTQNLQNGGGDCAGPDKQTLLSLPKKVRQRIWMYIDDQTVRALRSVCAQLRHEMDYEVGLSITLSSDTFNNMWMRSISIRSCEVKRMDNIFCLNLMARPDKLEKLSFDHDLYMDADITELVIRKFRNLRQLTIYTEDIAELRSEHDEALSNLLSSTMIARLDDQFELTSIDVKFDTNKWKLKWNIKLKPQEFGKFWEIKNVIESFGASGIAKIHTRDLSNKSLRTATLSIPFVQEHDRVVWLKVLKSQNRLVSLTCDLNTTHWKEYERIIRANHRTLKKLFLLNITNISNVPSGDDDNSLVHVEEAPFDWEIFESCKALEEITLIADTFMRQAATSRTRRYVPCVNITTLTCPLLRAVWLENFKFSQEQLEFLQNHPESSVKARFELCTLKNCKIDEEEVAERQIGLKRGRNRSLECLCFGTVSYDDDSAEKFCAKYKSLPDLDLSEKDMIDFFQLGNLQAFEVEPTGARKVGQVLFENANLIGGAIFTAWLAWC